MQEIKELSQSKEYQESATIKSTSKKNHNQKSYQGVPKSWVLKGSTTKSAYRVRYKRTLRECHNQKYWQNNLQKYQGVSQSKELPGTAIIKSTARDATIKSTARECHNKYIQGVQQIEVQRGDAIIKMTTREYNIQNYFQGVPQSKV